MNEKYCVNAASYTRYFASTEGVVAPTGEPWLGAESKECTGLRTDIHKLPFSKKPEQLAREVGKTLAELSGGKIVCKMGAWLPAQEPVA
jgi:hypothetical protein